MLNRLRQLWQSECLAVGGLVARRGPPLRQEGRIVRYPNVFLGLILAELAGRVRLQGVRGSELIG